ncbi:sugar ABC transporter substrate-binding protein, partial [Methylophaga sp. 42_8_T64]
KSYQAAAPFADFVLNAIQTADPVDSTREPKPYLGIQAVSIPEYPALGNQVSQQIVNVIEGKTTIDAALRQSQKLVKKQMQRSGYYQQK